MKRFEDLNVLRLAIELLMDLIYFET